MSFSARCRSCASVLRRGDLSLHTRNFASTSAAGAATIARVKPIPQPRDGIDTPSAFLAAISRAPRRDLASDSNIATALGEDWSEMFKLRGDDLKKKGVSVAERRYLLWALERFRQGQDPKKFAYQPKPKKLVRGWGARVQKGTRVSGRQRPGEK
ncbi:hypothetical protein K437DRAFT_254834 [Tilletiaria anomala UBC 951]|uniref:Small ribosomal subunit protein mS41 n=1 Tax=Tilletiaria anomala (strain ATCC 24038 / CBS 436.72 / UBC 951) TaxID=1037660 RepID=A0A066WBW4_TILAU|nr:uncharacterized protein K437DRAFT_254834 [Tilletiaria anomala UBC 951]KDN51422.1 hypothetical protein K437DRAFT_254834 [Tilletiaria anomala UBC 951]